MKKLTATATKHLTATIRALATPAVDGPHVCVLDACRGDRAAIGWIAVVLGKFLYEEIVDELGDDRRADADDAMQDFYLALCEARLLPPEPADAVAWLGRIAREFARAKKERA